MGRALVLFLFVSLAAPTATAQALDPSIQVDAVITHIDVPWNGTASAVWSVTNDGPVQVTVALSLEGQGAWNTDFAGKYPEFTLQAGGSRTITAVVSPTDADGPGGPGPALSLAATATDGIGRTASHDADVTASLVAAPAPPPMLPPDTTVQDVSLGVGAVLAGLAIAYLLVGYLYRVQVPAGPAQIRGVRGAWVHVRVRNLAPWSQTIALSLRRPDAAWQVSADTDRVTVKGRAEETLTIFVKRTKNDELEGTCTIGVRARRGFLYPWRRHGRVRVQATPVDMTAWSANAIGAALEQARAVGRPAAGGDGQDAARKA